MEIQINIENRANVTADSLAAFLSALKEQGFVDDDGVRHVSYDHWDPKANDRVGESFDTETVDDAIATIAANGVEYLSIGLSATSHYRYKGRPEGTDHFTKIMYCLNIAAAEVAKAVGEEISTDYYYNPTFQSGRFHTEYGENEICTLTLPGEGGYIPDDRWDECMDILRESMAKECPEFEQLIELMRSNFGEVSLKFEYNDLG